MQRLAAAVLAAALLLAATVTGAGAADASGGSGGGCTGWSTGNGWYVQCGTNPGGGDTTGHSGSGQSQCHWTTDVDKYWPGFTQTAPPPPKGYAYMDYVCPGPYNTELPALVKDAGALTPQILAQQAYTELQPATPDPQTAPPRGSDGLVGLPEWVWVPAGQWQTLTKTVRVGPVWATVTAVPSELTFSPGGGAAAMSCPGPGTPYDTALPASGQHTSCSYTYIQSSDGQPANSYQASVTLTWTATWVGSGGAAGTFAPLTRTAAFPLPVAEAQALNPGD
jgi:hypothetical protein